MIHRINVFLLCFFIAIAPARVFAETGGFLGLVLKSMENARTVSNGLKADFIFQNESLRRTFRAAGATIKYTDMAKVAKKRILCGTLVTFIACGIGTVLIVDYLEDEGWIIDKERQKIYKNEDGTEKKFYCTSTSSEPLYSLGQVAEACYAGTYNGNTNLGTTCEQNKPNKTGFLLGVKTTFTNGYRDAYCQISGVSEREITIDELAEIIKKTPVNVHIELSMSPDMNAEPHERLQEIAAEAKPEDGSDCPAGQKYDATKKDCVADTATTTKDETGTEKTEWPTFCNWAKAVCTYFDFAKPKVETITTKTTEIADETKASKEELKKQTQQDKEFYDWAYQEPDLKDEPLVIEQENITGYEYQNHVSFGSSCPFSTDSITVDLGIGSFDASADLTIFCQIAEQARPYLIGLSHFGGLLYVIYAIRNGNG